MKSTPLSAGGIPIAFAVCLVVTLVLLIAGCGIAGEASKPAAPAKQVTWNFHTVSGDDFAVVNAGYLPAFARIKEKTQGQVEGVVFQKSALGYNAADIWDVVGKGLIPAGEMYGSLVAGKYPWITVLELPFLFDVSNIELGQGLVDGLWDAFAEPLAKDNLELLAIAPLPFGRGLSVNKPLNSDPKAILQGMQIRSIGPATAWVIKILGGAPVTLATAEVYEALQRGIVNGMDMGPGSAITSQKFHEVVRTAVFVSKKDWEAFEYGSTTAVVVANKDAISSLSPEQQKIVREVWRSTMKEAMVAARKDQVAGVREAVEKYGMASAEVSPETLAYVKARAGEYWTEWTQKAGPYGANILDKAKKIVEANQKK